jgi:hypothetical protein
MPLQAILSQASTLAMQYRKSGSGSRDRPDRSSSELGTPPGTPPRRASALGEDSVGGRRGSGSSEGLSARQESTDRMTSSASSTSLLSLRDGSTPRPRPTSRLSSFTRNSIFGGDRKVDTAEKTSASSDSSFDAVLHFIPNAASFPPGRALQDMLQQSVMITSGVLPLLTSKPSSSKSTTINSPDVAQVPIGLIHIVPFDVPGPLPSVIESFLLALLPSMAGRGGREVWGSVVSSQAWYTPRVDMGRRPPNASSTETYCGAEVILFGGVRCPHQLVAPQDGSRAQAFLANWSSCFAMPGLIAETRQSAVKAASSPVVQRDQTPNEISNIQRPREDRPLSPHTKAPPAGIRGASQLPPPSRLRHSATSTDIADAPSTPDLDTGGSSCSSSLAPASRGESLEGDVDSREEGEKASAMGGGEKRKGLGKWFRNKMRS